MAAERRMSASIAASARSWWRITSTPTIPGMADSSDMKIGRAHVELQSPCNPVCPIPTAFAYTTLFRSPHARLDMWSFLMGMVPSGSPTISCKDIAHSNGGGKAHVCLYRGKRAVLVAHYLHPNDPGYGGLVGYEDRKSTRRTPVTL